MIEVHTDVVHAPSLRASLSLTYDDLAEDTYETPAGMLMIAIVHGAFSHGFERLQHAGRRLPGGPCARYRRRVRRWNSWSSAPARVMLRR